MGFDGVEQTYQTVSYGMQYTQQSYLTHVWRGYDMVTGDGIFSFVAQKNNDGDFVKHHSVVWHASS